MTIKPNDNLIIGAHSEEDDVSHVDIYLYEEQEDNLFIHHDIILSSFPLSLAWMNYGFNTDLDSNQNKGNFLAIGTFKPEIEIWNLDVIGAVEPTVVLGATPASADEADKTKKKTQKKSELVYNNYSHRGAVMSLSWNALTRSCLSSGSADHSIKLWDLEKCLCTSTIVHHSDKVQAVKFHPLEAHVLASGAYDRNVCITDIRDPQKIACKLPRLSADVESLDWMTPQHSQDLLAASENGQVVRFDLRQPTKPVWTLSAYAGHTCSAMHYNGLVPEFAALATGSTDKSLKVWDLTAQEPKLAYQEKMKFPIFCVNWYATAPYLLAVGGKGQAGYVGENLEERLVIRNFKQMSASNSNNNNNNSNNLNKNNNNNNNSNQGKKNINQKSGKGKKKM
jgi:periodic tryptophan protein 1